MIREERLPAQRWGRDWFIAESDLALVADRKPGRPKKAEAPAGSAEAQAVTFTPARKARAKAVRKARKPAKKGGGAK
jgi:hypothetical protein